MYLFLPCVSAIIVFVVLKYIMKNGYVKEENYKYLNSLVFIIPIGLFIYAILTQTLLIYILTPVLYFLMFYGIAYIYHRSI